MPERLLDQESATAEDPFYIRVPSSRVDVRTRVLKHGDTFAVFDRYGDIVQLGLGELGLYHAGTRFLSHLEFRLAELRPLLLSSTMRRDNTLLAVDLTNPDLPGDATPPVPRGTLHFARSTFLWRGICHERLRVSNHGPVPVQVRLGFDVGADFADIFEIRGLTRDRSGRLLEPEARDGALVIGYEGLDRVIRRTRVTCDPAPDSAGPTGVRFTTRLEPTEEKTVFLAIACELPADDSTRRAPERESARRPRRNGPKGAPGVPGTTGPATAPADSGSAPLSYFDALSEAERDLVDFKRGLCRIETSNDQFNVWLDRSVADLHLMITRTPEGPYPYAGVPWFSTPFGRDGILTALECLSFHPPLAGGVLRYLAATQARELDPARDAEPGKILHETRRGEMAALGEIPFGLYYGSVDATPLFVLLAGAWFERTADRHLLESLWPAVELALDWIDRYGDADQDGFVEYARQSRDGLVQQGWKDSQDSVSHADGTLAEPPIALCEVQGYVYAARRHASQLAASLGRNRRAHELSRQADELRRSFQRAFWDDALSTFVLALDGEKRPCRVRASNAGHCLFSGVASLAQARAAARTLLGEPSFSGWGVRTLASTEARYNPMSYHNGSVWPHDNAVVAAGLARYGLKGPALRILDGLFGASTFVELHRLPELFCGFPRRSGEGPILYPVACAPQAWAAAAVFLLLQACLGISIEAEPPRVRLVRPVLPEFLQHVRISNLAVGDSTVDLLLERRRRDVAVEVRRRSGDVEVLISK